MSDDIPCPAAQDRARNRHRDGPAWSKSAIRAILANPATPAPRTGHITAAIRTCGAVALAERVIRQG
jgi:hypothetical protein